MVLSKQKCIQEIEKHIALLERALGAFKAEEEGGDDYMSRYSLLSIRTNAECIIKCVNARVETMNEEKGHEPTQVSGPAGGDPAGGLSDSPVQGG